MTAATTPRPVAREVAIGTRIQVPGRVLHPVGTVTGRMEHIASGMTTLEVDGRDHVTVPSGQAIDLAAGRSAGDVALGTLRSEPGGFGAAVARLGFGEFRPGSSPNYGEWLSSEHASGLFRVVCRPDDGDTVDLIGWDPARPHAKLLAWKVSFDGSTPQSIVLAAIANAVGELPVTA